MQFSIIHSTEGGWSQVQLLDHETGACATIIPAAGGILNGFSIPAAHGTINIIDGFSDAIDWQERKEKGFQSAKLSPFVCRIKNSSYQWDGEQHTFDKFRLNDTAIHGIIYDACFQIIDEIVHADYAELELKYSYDGSIKGYPFPYDCFIRYRLEKARTLLVSTAIHNRAKLTIPMSDGWHPYFTLGGGIQKLTLQFHASHILEYDDEILPTGNLLPQTAWNEPRTLNDTFLDNGFLVDYSKGQPACILKDPETGISISFFPEPSYPYLQIYTPPHRRSIAIENLSAAPDAFNNGMGLTRIEPDHTKTYSLRYRIDTP